MKCNEWGVSARTPWATPHSVPLVSHAAPLVPHLVPLVLHSVPLVCPWCLIRFPWCFILCTWCLLCGMQRVGGFSKYPGGHPDILHSFYGVCGLSLAGVPGLKPVYGSLGICLDAAKAEFPRVESF